MSSLLDSIVHRSISSPTMLHVPFHHCSIPFHSFPLYQGPQPVTGIDACGLPADHVHWHRVRPRSDVWGGVASSSLTGGWTAEIRNCFMGSSISGEIKSTCSDGSCGSCFLLFIISILPAKSSKADWSHRPLPNSESVVQSRLCPAGLSDFRKKMLDGPKEGSQESKFRIYRRGKGMVKWFNLSKATDLSLWMRITSVIIAGTGTDHIRLFTFTSTASTVRKNATTNLLARALFILIVIAKGRSI